LRRDQGGALAPRQGSVFPWIRLRYSYRSLSTEGDRTHVVIRERRFEDGRLEAEDVEATVDRRWITGLLEQAPERLRHLLRSLLER